QGRVTGPHGVVLMSDRGAKQRHNAIAHDLVHGALIAVHGFHHALQDRIEELPGLLRVTVGQQLHGTLQVCEEHGNLLALAFQGRTRGEDLFGEVARRVGLRRDGVEGETGHYRGGEGCATVATEVKASRILLTALRAGMAQPYPASTAKPYPSPILKATTRAVHLQ